MQILQLNYVTNDDRVLCPACWDESREPHDPADLVVQAFSEEPCRDCGREPEYIAHIPELGAEDASFDEDDA